MPIVSRVVTMHAEVSMRLQLALLDGIEATLQQQGASRIWIDSGGRPDLLVLAEFEEQSERPVRTASFPG